MLFWLLASIAAYAGLNGQARAATVTGGPAIPQGPPVVDRLDVDAIEVSTVSYSAMVMARTMWAEARGDGYTGMQSVANVIMNRLKISQTRPNVWWGKTIEEICFRNQGGIYQFSCWDPRDPNMIKAASVNMSNPQFAQAMEIALLARAGKLPDLTKGSTHYHTTRVKPAWSVGAVQLAAVGNHLFYKVA